MAWWLNAARAYTVKLVNPGGAEVWKGGRNARLTDLTVLSDTFLARIGDYRQVPPPPGWDGVFVAKEK